jgi:uncharacterized membrane protein YebE (DUF533 family)
MNWLKVIAIITCPVIAIPTLAGKAIYDKSGETKKELQKERAKTAILEGKLSQYNDHQSLTLALFAVGMSAANADGVICESENEAIDIFVGGLPKSKLPKSIQDTMIAYRIDPPNLNTAIAIVEKLFPNPDWEMFKEFLNIVFNADGAVSHSEKAFLKAFSKKIAA